MNRYGLELHQYGLAAGSPEAAGYQDVTLPMKVVRLGSMAPACAVD
jgi:hypothetical protein